MNIIPNLQIRPEDIRNNPELWIQKISVILFTDENGKPWWTKEYKFLPNHKRYNQAVKWIRDTNFEEYNCRIVQNANNEIEIITRNYFGKKASLEQEEKEVLGKIRKRLGEEIRKPDEELIEEFSFEYEPGEVELPEARFIEVSTDWTQFGFTPQQKQDWLNIGLTEEDGEFADWLRKVNKLSPEQVLNHGNEKELREEYYKSSKQIKEPSLSSEQKKILEEYRQSLTKLGKSKNVEEFLESEFREIYEEEAEELERLEREKESLGESGVSYDLGRPDLAILWRKQLYFVSSFEYVNNWKLTVQIRARKCLLGMYYWNWMLKTSGAGTIEKSPIVQDREHRLHYEFCSDLGIKRIYQWNFTSYQPEFQLFRTKVNYRDGAGRITWSHQGTFEGQEPKALAIPTDIRLTRFGETEANDIYTNWATDAAMMAIIKFKSIMDITGASFRDLGKMLLDARVVLTIGPKEMDPEQGAYWSKQYLDKQEFLFSNRPELTAKFRNQPHLWDHTTFQFYFFNKIAMTANGRYLGIRGVDRENKVVKNWENNPEQVDRFILPYKLFINYAPGNLYYRWEFEFITVKCEISNEGSFDDWTNPARVMRGFNFKIAGKVLATGGGFGFGTNWNDIGEEAGKMKQGDDPAAEQEAQTERMFKNTFRNVLDKAVEPSMFNANTIDFHYSLGEFFNRLCDPIFFYRIEFSELLSNRLNWANNKQKVNRLPIHWDNLAKFSQVAGLWKWSEVNLESDVQGFFTQRMLNGYFLTDGEKLGNPDFTFERTQNIVKVGGNAWDITQAEEETIEREIITKERGDTVNIDGIDVATGGKLMICSIFGISSINGGHSGIMKKGTTTDYFKQLCEADLTAISTNAGSYISNTWWYFPAGLKWTKTYSIPADIYEITWHTNVGLDDRHDIPADSFTITIDGDKGTLTTHGETEIKKIIRETILKESKKTVSQTIDEKLLEQEGEEVEDTFEPELDTEKIEKEQVEQGIGERSLEKEQEREQEKEQELEKEAEQEQETEKEDEKETEQEKEKEREKESETTQEQTQEQEKPESEGEQEEEEEL